MYKMFRFFILFSCFIFQTVIGSSFSPFGSNPEKTAHELGQGLSSGIVDGFGKKIDGVSENDIARLGQKCLAATGSLCDSKEMEQLIKKGGTDLVKKTMVGVAKGVELGTKEGSSILKDAMTEGTTNIADGAKDSVNIAAKAWQDVTSKNGELEKSFISASNQVGRNVNRFVIKNIVKVSAVVLATAASYWTLAYGIPLGFKMLERSWTRPKLIISSSKKGFFEWLFGVKAQPIPMIFSAKLEKELNDIVTITQTIHNKIKSGKSNVTYRNLLLYGPPGTGKTLFATELAKRSGLEYVFMSGSSFSKFKDGEGIEALDELFAWANKSTGLLIFIDEAETFLLKRENMHPQSQAYLLLNNFLNYTGTRSNKFMIVFATNHKDVLDSAMYRRIDDLIEILLPAKNERIRILNLYIQSILLNENHNEALFVNSVKKVLTPNVVAEIADKTKGLSGGELESLINAIKTSADILEPAILTKQHLDEMVDKSVAKYMNFTGGKMLGLVEN